MVEQEKYKRLLKQLIDETENNKIQSAQEMVQKIIRELTKKNNLKEDLQTYSN